tara:strand:+ start:268 stop:894 length:627 start_codon:yes stop_codon:yes gene_type:complete
MKSIIFIMGMVTACGPSELKTDKQKMDTAQTESPSEADPVGIITAEDCQQIDIGDKACNFRLTDQNGKTWDLYEHSGQVIVLDFSAVWCYPCQLAGDHSQAIQDEFQDDGVQMVTVLVDGATSGLGPTEEEVEYWANSHGVTTAPVLQGSRDKMIDSQVPGDTEEPGVTGYLLNAFPTYLYIGRDMKFYAGHVGFSEEYVRQKIQEGL